MYRRVVFNIKGNDYRLIVAIAYKLQQVKSDSAKNSGIPVDPLGGLRTGAAFEDVRALVVERFDRRVWTPAPGAERLLRLPQEDLCQALGVGPEAKYEADGGPGMDRILDLLDGSLDRDRARRLQVVRRSPPPGVSRPGRWRRDPA